MQQSVLLTAIRGPDGLPKDHISKYLLRWYRRCILISAFDGKALTEPYSPQGGSFTGPSIQSWETEDTFEAGDLAKGITLVVSKDWVKAMDALVDQYMRSLDAVPHHFQLHFLHGAEIIGYKHPDDKIRHWWEDTYIRLVQDLHLEPESKTRMNFRLGDQEKQWRECQVGGNL